MVAWRVPNICWERFVVWMGRSHLRISSIRTEPSLEPIIWILLYKMILNLNSMLGVSHPPSFFGRWRVVIGTLNVAPFHMNQVQIVVSCLRNCLAMEKFESHTIVLLRDMVVRIAVLVLDIGYLHKLSWLARAHYI
jgi:hypothetical protein